MAAAAAAAGTTGTFAAGAGAVIPTRPGGE